MAVYQVTRTVTFELFVSADDVDAAAELAGDVEYSQWDELPDAAMLVERI